MFMPYDMDTVIGLEWTGEVVYDDTTGSQTMDNSQTSFWRKVKKLITQKSRLVINSLEI